MPLAIPIDIGDPTGVTSFLTLGSRHQVNGSNFSSEASVLNLSERTMEDRAEPFWFEVGNQGHVHGKSQFTVQNPRVYGNGHLRYRQALGYYDVTPARVLQDLIVHKAHVGHGRVRIFPTNTQAAGNWISTVTGLGTNLENEVDEGTDQKDGTYITTTTINDTVVLGFFTTLPGNLVRVREIAVNIWSGIREDTVSKRGNCLKVNLYSNATSGTPGLGTQEGVTKYAFTKVGDATGVPLRFYRVLFKGLNITKANGQNMELDLITNTQVGTGSSVNYQAWVDAVDIDIWFEPTSDILLVDEASFDTLHTYYNITVSPAVVLGGSFVDKTIEEAVLEILAHIPESFIYINNRSQISIKKLSKFSDVTTPEVIGPSNNNFGSVIETELYKERLVTSIGCRYDSRTGLNQYAGTTGPGVEDPSNVRLYRVRFDDYFEWRALPESKQDDLEREWFYSPSVTDPSGATNGLENVTRFISNYNDIWNKEVHVLRIGVLHSVFENQLGDVVAMDIDELGYDNKKMTIVRREIDLDEMTGELVLYDIEFTDPTEDEV